MSEADPVLELLAQWEEHRSQGRTVTPEELCPHDATLQDALRKRIARHERLRAVFELPAHHAETLQAGARASPTSFADNVPTIPGYEILEVLGHGGMGVVYKARQRSLNRFVAVKMILSGPAARRDELTRLRTEAEAVAKLQHPNIVSIYEIGEAQGRPYLALELLPRGSLADSLTGTPLPPRQAAQLAMDIAKAVQHAHERGVIHRDLKPSNILLAADGTPKVGDFGLAKRLESDEGFTMTGAVLGSPSYMSPEQAEGRLREIGPATDIYAIGAILYELLSGRPPFRAATVVETLEQVRTHAAAPLRVLQPKTPKDLETICQKCLEKNPTQRYASAAEVAADLQRWLSGEPIQARPLTMVDQMARAISRRGPEAHFLPWSTNMFLAAPLPIVLHTTAWWWTYNHPWHAEILIGVSSLMVILNVMFIIIGNIKVLRHTAGAQGRHFISVWTSHMVGVAAMTLVVWQLRPFAEPADLFVIYPLWAILVATAFFSHGAEVGMFYLIGVGCLVVALIMAFTLPWAPLELGVLMSCNMTAVGLYVRSSEPLRAEDVGP